MKLSLVKKLGIVGIVAGMMSTAVVADTCAWEMNMYQSQEVISSKTAVKTAESDAARNKYAFINRTDGSAIWSRTP